MSIPEILEKIHETELDFLELRHRFSIGNAGLDPRTNVLGNLTRKLLNTDPYRTLCDPDEGFFDKYLNYPGAITERKYIYEIHLHRSVVQISFPSFEDVSTAEVDDAAKVTLVTQLTSDRSYMLDPIVERWKGPAVIVVYASNFFALHKQLSHWLMEKQRRDIKVVIVEKAGRLYPVNWLRNLGLVHAASKYVFVVDGDFVSSRNLHLKLSKYMQKVESLGRGTVALLVPAFEMLQPRAFVPQTRADLLKAYSIGEVDGFHMSSFPLAHNLTDYEKWRKSDRAYFLPQTQQCDDHFEPYLVIHRAKSPWFPETLLERRKNKIAYRYELCTRGYQFIVVHDGFIVHKHHSRDMGAMSKTDKCADAAWDVFKMFLNSSQLSSKKKKR